MKTIHYLDENNKNLFSRQKLKSEELSARLLADYIVNNGVVYENMGSWFDDVVKIKLNKIEGEETYLNHSKNFNFKSVEYRKYEDEPSKRGVLKIIKKDSVLELMPHLLEFSPTLQNKQLKRCASEVDEDREIFVVYYLDECECEK